MKCSTRKTVRDRGSRPIRRSSTKRGSLTASLPGFVRLAPGSAVKAEIDPDHLLVFDRKSGKRRAPQRQS